MLLFYEQEIQFVDPIKKQTHPEVNLHNWTEWIKNLSQFDIDQEGSWYKLTPGSVNQNRSAVLRSKDVPSVAVLPFPGSEDARMYSRSEVSSFWDSTLISTASPIALKKFSQRFIVFSNNEKDHGSFPYFAAHADFLVDKMISVGYFEDQLLNTIGSLENVFEHCGNNFSVFLFSYCS